MYLYGCNDNFGKINLNQTHYINKLTQKAV